MGDNVAAIRPDVIVSAAKQQFLDYAADRYDAFVAQFGQPLACCLMSFVGPGGAGITPWYVADEYDELTTLLVARGLLIMQSEVTAYDQATASDADT